VGPASSAATVAALTRLIDRILDEWARRRAGSRVIIPAVEREHAEVAGAVGRIGRGTAVTWLAWVGGRVLTLVTLVLLTNALPPEGVGALLAALATGVLGAALAMGGLPDATTRHAASAADAGFGKGDVRRSLRRFAVTLPVIAALLVAIAYASPDAVDAAVVVAGLALASTQGATTIVASIFRARGQAGRFAFVTTLFVSIGRAFVGLAALVFELDVGVVLWSFVGLNAALILLTCRSALAGLPDTEARPEGEGAMQLGGVVWSLMGNLDLVVVGVVLGAEAAGVYGAALRIAEVSVQFLIALSVLYLPEATRLAVRGATDALATLYRTTCRWSSLISLLAAGAGFVMAPALGRVVFPDDAETASTLLRILLVGFGVHGALGQTYSTLLALGAYADIRRASLVTLPALVAGTVALAAAFGTVGAAAATCVAYVATACWWAHLVARHIGVSPFDRLYGRALVACATSWIAAAVVFRLVADAAPAAGLLATGAAAIAAWLVALRVGGGLSRSERVSVARLGARLGRATG
jgi:O-antigen/teichoic acid export membrane protein